MNQSERRNFLIQSLLEESREYRGMQIPSDSTGQRQLLRGLMNVRMVKKSSAEFLNIQDAYLQEETAKKGVTDVDDLTPVQQGLYLWQGDITALRCDAIVNAANSGMTGCYVPNHRCIDNCIHTFAGVQLRLYCEEMMEAQGHAEPTGQAKITPAYNLPCRYVLHTVGPIVGGHLTETHCRQLADCYRSCMSLAAENGLKKRGVLLHFHWRISFSERESSGDCRCDGERVSGAERDERGEGHFQRVQGPRQGDL